MINATDAHALNVIIHQAAGGRNAHEGAVSAPGAAGMVPADVVSMSPLVLGLLLHENLGLAFNAAAPDAAVKAPASAMLADQVQAAALGTAANPDFFTYLANAMGGPFDVAAMMAAQQAGTPQEPVTVAPVAGVAGTKV